MNKVIAITLYNRPRQTAELFKHLSRCVGLAEYNILINVDGDTGSPEVQRVYDLVQEFSATYPSLNFHCYHDHGHLGIDEVKLFLLEKAYATSDYVILCEDDTWPTIDTLKWLELQYTIHGKDPNFIAACAFHYHPKDSDIEDYRSVRWYEAEEFHWMTPWLFGMTKATWHKLFDKHRYVAINDHYDTVIGDYMLAHPDAYSVRPPLSHVMLVDAAEGAVHTPSQEWFDANERTWIHRGLLER